MTNSDSYKEKEAWPYQICSFPSWLLGDHLGSTSMVADASGVAVSEVRYSTFGETRYQNGTLTTDYLYTGQRQEAEIGLYYFVARWYDPAIGRFIQADSIVPNPASAKGFDRYGYGFNNPIRYADPTGHTPILLDGEQFAETDKSSGITNHISTSKSKYSYTWSPPIKKTKKSSSNSGDSPHRGTNYPDYKKTESSLQAFGLVTNWFFETGPSTTVFTEQDSLTMDIMAGPGIEEFRGEWANAGYPVPFTYHHTIDDRENGSFIDGMWSFVEAHVVNNSLSLLGFGSDTAEGEIDAVGGTIGSLDRIDVVQYDASNVMLVVHNTMGWASGTRIPGTDNTLLNDRNRSEFGPGGTTWQIFIWLEPNPREGQ